MTEDYRQKVVSYLHKLSAKGRFLVDVTHDGHIVEAAEGRRLWDEFLRKNPLPPDVSQEDLGSLLGSITLFQIKVRLATSLGWTPSSPTSPEDLFNTHFVIQDNRIRRCSSDDDSQTKH